MSGNLAVNLGRLTISDRAFVKSIHLLWPTIPVDVDGTVVQVNNFYGRLIGYETDPAYAYNYNGEMNSWPVISASFAATINWATD
ncbi:MAG: hypothetical protein Q8M76_06850 [Spirochaetaceae bacterium]|nr:hypothetical protein [Spirochaetaceae bacterium]